MKLLPIVCSYLVVALAFQAVPVSGAAKLERWVDKQGNSFRATPVDILGPFALFLTDKKGGKRVIVSQLSETDCVRFHRGISELSPRADKWVAATGMATSQVLANVSILDGEQFFNPDFTRVPEPELLMLFFAEYSAQRTFEALREFLPEYQRVRERFGGLCEALFINVRSTENEFGNMARDLKVPFLIENYRDRERLHHIRQYAPKKAPTLMIMTRTGAPIALSECQSKSDIERAVLEMEALLNFMRPGNQRTWSDRLYYHRAVRLGMFKSGTADPLLVGHLLDTAALRQAGITTVVAKLEVAADGTVNSADVQPTGGVTPETADLLGATLVKSAVVPAVRDGEFVEGSFEVRIEP